MDGIFNTEEGIALIKQENEINKKLNIAQWKFIEEHPENIVGYDLALQFLQGMYVNLTVPQLEQLTALITKAWANIPPMAENFKTIADKAKTMAIGEKYQDIELMNPEGKMVKLSSCVPEGKYVMLEFWASCVVPAGARFHTFVMYIRSIKTKALKSSVFLSTKRKPTGTRR